MKITLFFSVAFSLVSIVFSAVSLYQKPEGKKGHCWTEHTGPLVAGEKRIYFENKCMRILCLDNTLAQIATCRLLEGVDVEAEIDNSKPYPECCPRP